MWTEELFIFPGQLSHRDYTRTSVPCAWDPCTLARPTPFLLPSHVEIKVAAHDHISRKPAKLTVASRAVFKKRPEPLFVYNSFKISVYSQHLSSFRCKMWLIFNTFGHVPSLSSSERHLFPVVLHHRWLTPGGELCLYILEIPPVWLICGNEVKHRCPFVFSLCSSCPPVSPLF